MYSFEENEKILSKWEQISEARGDGSVSPDGVYYKGDYHKWESDGKTYSERNRGNEDEQWNTAKRRVLFVSKDSNEEDNAYDMRCCDLTHDFNGNLRFKWRFVKNMLRINAGLQSVSSKSFIPYSDINNIEVVDKIWDESAVARINVKKHSGGSSLSNAALKQVLSENSPYAELIEGQLNLLDANIIVCCGGRGILKDFVINHCYSDAVKENWWVYYSPNHNVWIIDSFHMNPRNATTDEGLYTDMMKNFQEALIKIGKEEPIR